MVLLQFAGVAAVGVALTIQTVYGKMKDARAAKNPQKKNPGFGDYRL